MDKKKLVKHDSDDIEDENKGSMDFNNIGQVGIMSFGFLLLFTAQFTVQNFATTTLSDDGFDNLGFTSLAVLFFTFSLTSFFSAAIVKKIGYIQVSMSLGALCYAFWILTNILPSYYSEASPDQRTGILNASFIKTMIIITSMIEGFGAGILWTAQGKFISECAHDGNKGFFNSFFWGMFMSSQIVGNIIGEQVLKQGGRISTIYMIFGIIAVFGSLIFCILKVPEDEEKNTVSEKQQSSCEVMRETVKMLRQDKMVHLIFGMIIWSSISLAMYTTIFVPLLKRTMGSDLTEIVKNENSYFCMSFLGLGEIVGGVFLIGPIRDRCGNKPALITLIFITALSLGLVFIVNQNNHYDSWGPIMCFVWGLQDSGVNCLMLCILGFEFGDDKMTPFAVQKFIQSMGIFAFCQLAGSIIGDEGTSEVQQQTNIKLFILYTGAFALLGLLSMICFKYKEAGGEEEGSDSESEDSDHIEQENSADAEFSNDIADLIKARSAPKKALKEKKNKQTKQKSLNTGPKKLPGAYWWNQKRFKVHGKFNTVEERDCQETQEV